MHRLSLIACSALCFITGCGGCGTSVSSSNIARYSRTRSADELDSAMPMAPPVAVPMPPQSPPAKSSEPAKPTPTDATPTSKIINADDPTPIEPARTPPVAPKPAAPMSQPSTQPLVIDADDPTPIPVRPPQPPAQAPMPAARSLPPGVIDADDPTPTAVRNQPQPSRPSVENKPADSAAAKQPLPTANELEQALAALNLGGPKPPSALLRPAPSDEEQKEIKSQLREIYQSDVEAAKTAEQRQALAKKLLTDAERAQGNAATLYGLLTVARELAAKSGDIATAVHALDQLEANFDGHWIEARVKTLNEISSNLAKNAAQNQNKLLANEVEKVLAAAIARQDFALGQKAHSILVEAARRTGDKQFVARTTSLKNELETLRTEFRAVPPAIEKLRQEPEDAAANQVVGRYLCFVANRWEQGLPLLAKSEDVRLKVLANIELNQKTPKAMIELADEWWELGQRAKTPVNRGLLLRAVHWYSQGVGLNAQGIERLRAEKRINEASNLLGKEKGVTSPATTGQVIDAG